MFFKVGYIDIILILIIYCPHKMWKFASTSITLTIIQYTMMKLIHVYISNVLYIGLLLETDVEWEALYFVLVI